MEGAPPLSTWEQRMERIAVPIVLRPSLEATWVLACSLIASGQLSWDGESIFRITAAWLVVDALLGCVFAQLTALKQVLSALPKDRPVVPLHLFQLPYAEPDSPGKRLMDWLNTALPDLRDWLLPAVGPNSITALVSAALALISATYLGRGALSAVAGALLAGAWLSLLTGRSTVALSRWLRGVHVGVAWVVGLLMMGGLEQPALALGIVLGLGAHGRSYLRGGTLWLAKIQWVGVWTILVGVLLVARQPVPAAFVATAALADSIIMGNLPGSDVNPDSLRGRIGWLLSTLVLALAVAQWP